MNKPAISIIIPVYNVEKYLGRCLDSVLSQTFTNWEAICINDGSTDNSFKILEEYAQKDSRIKIFSQENQGVSIARNKAIKQAKGNYICFLDSDDFFDGNFLSNLYSEIIKIDADVVMTSTRYITDKKSTKSIVKKNTFTSFTDKVQVLSHGGCWDKIYKKSFLTNYKLQFPDGLYWEDNVFIIKVCFYSNKMSVIDGASYNYVCNPTSITRDKHKFIKRSKDSLIIAKIIMDFVISQNCSNKEKNVVADFCLLNFINSKDLLDKEFYASIKEIIGNTKLLKKQRRKQIKKKILHNIRNWFRKLLNEED